MSLKSFSPLALHTTSEATAQPLPAAEQLALLHHLADLSHPVAPTPEPPPYTSKEIADAYQFCQHMIRQHSKSFFFSTQFLPPAKRQSVYALYAFCRITDDKVDQPEGDPARSLALWVHRVQAAQPAANDPVLAAWHDVRSRCNLPVALQDELLAGVAMDLTIHRYANFADLWLYCYRVASVVGLLSIHITGAAPGAASYAIKLGVALQMTNILRDVGEDAQRGRVYLPQDELARFGLTDNDILAGVRDDRLRRLMQFQIARTKRLYDESWVGIALLPSDSRLGVAAAARVYRGILDKIVLNDYDVYTKRAYLTLREKLVRLPLTCRDVWRLDTRSPKK